MSDPYATLAAQDRAVQERIAEAMEARCLEPAQQAIRDAYLGQLSLPPGASALELGSGTGHVTHDLLGIAGAATALGIEPSPVMVARATKAFSGIPNLRFDIGDAKDTGLADASFDLIVMHTLLCHVPGPEAVIHEAHRLLKPGGVLAICDGNYDTTTARIAAFDPLDQVVRFMIDQNVTNLWIMREVSKMLADAGRRTLRAGRPLTLSCSAPV